MKDFSKITKMRIAKNQTIEKIFLNAQRVIKSKGKGKSDGGRIIFYFEVIEEKVILLFIYDKSEMENVQSSYIEQILQAWFDR